MPSDFSEKFSGIINNVNTLNGKDKESPIKIEDVYKTQPEFAAVPKEGDN
jgi:hypothetical protein